MVSKILIILKLIIIFPMSSGNQFVSVCLYNTWVTWAQRMPESEGNYTISANLCCMSKKNM